MRTIALITQKGGTGKTTLAVSLATTAQAAGENVLALDLDPQGSLAAWGDMRSADTPRVERVPAQHIPTLPKTLRGMGAKGFTLAILDTAGADNPITHTAMQAADLCLVPLRPTRLDALAVAPTVQAITRIGRPFAFVLTQCSTIPRNSRAGEMAAGLQTLGWLAEPLIAQRADHQDAFAAGQGVNEYAPQSKAAEEVRGLWNWINTKTKGLN
jgi:chromosome partitioning protein